MSTDDEFGGDGGADDEFEGMSTDDEFEGMSTDDEFESDGGADREEEEEAVAVDDTAILSDFEGSVGEEQPELYPNNNTDVARRDRENVISWFGAASSIARDTEEAPQQSSDDLHSSSEGGSEDDGGCASKTKYSEFHDTDISYGRRLKLCEGLKFKDLELFKKALQQFCIQNGFTFNYVKCDKVRVTAKCAAPNCKWRIHCSIENGGGGFQIKTMTSKHECGTHYINRAVTAKWIAMQYLEKIRDTPHLTTTALIEEIRRDWMVGVSKFKAYRGLKLALKIVNGSHAEQYNKCYDYAAAVSRFNPGSTAIVHREGPFFKRMYVRLGACRAGFLAGCRPVISVDACHLKGPYGGQLFCAVAKDGNDDMFPISYAVCENECKASWVWFLESLLDDVGVFDTRQWVFISDRQKGLLDAFEILVPNLEHRYCIKHLHANMKKYGWKGQAYKEVLWKCAKASNAVAFEKHMKEMKALSGAAHHYLSLIPPKAWSRHAFSTHCKSDMLLNNIAETFNAWVLEARDKPLLSMMEIIRRMLMNRFYGKRVGIEKVTFDICPRIQEKLEKNKEFGSHFICRWGNGVEFEVDHHTEERRVVNTVERTCTCGRWQLNGIPCAHVVSAIYFSRRQPEEFVDNYYRIDTYRRTYALSIQGMPGPELWPRVNEDPPTQPPLIRPRAGRPKMSRRRAEDEPPPPPPGRVSRRGYITKCGRCGAIGHNARRCKLPPKPGERKYPSKPYTKKTKPRNRANGEGTSGANECPQVRTRGITQPVDNEQVSNVLRSRGSQETQPERIFARRAKGVERAWATQ